MQYNVASLPSSAVPDKKILYTSTRMQLFITRRNAA